MGFFSKAKRPKATEAEKALMSRSAALYERADRGLDGSVRAGIADAMDTTAEKADLLGQINVATSQNFRGVADRRAGGVRGGGDSLARAIQRAKGQQRATQFASDEIDNKALTDRININRAGRRQQLSTLGYQSNLLGQATASQQASSLANATKSAGLSDLLGSVVGGGISALTPYPKPTAETETSKTGGGLLRAT